MFRHSDECHPRFASNVDNTTQKPLPIHSPHQMLMKNVEKIGEKPQCISFSLFFWVVS